MDPQGSNTLFPSNHFPSLSSPNNVQYFSIEVDCQVFYALNGVIVNGVTDTIEFGVPTVPTQEVERFIYMVFSYFEVPENARPRMAAKILGYAEELMIEAPKDQQILDMYVVLAHTSEIPLYNDDDDYYDDGVVEESMNEDEDMRIVPASEASIEGLEKVNLEGSAEGNCTICLDDFSIHSEAIRMPCSHLFHKTCITSWLHCRNTCPLCRSPMPTEDDE